LRLKKGEFAMRWGVVAAGVAVVVVVGVGIRIASNRGASGGLDMALSHLPPGYAATHGPISFDPLTGTAHMNGFVLTHNGVAVLTAADANVTGIGSIAGGVPKRIGHVTLKDISAPAWAAHVDRMEADGLETANMQALSDPAAFVNGKPAWTDRRPILASLKLFGTVVHVPADLAKHVPAYDLSIKREHVDGVSARPFAFPASVDAARQPAFTASVLQAIAIDNAGNEDLKAEIPGSGKLTVQSDTAQNFDGGRVASYEIDGIGFVSEKTPGTAHFGQLIVTGVDATQLLARLPEFAADPKAAQQKYGNAMRIESFEMRDGKFDFAHAPLVTLADMKGATESHSGDFSASNYTLTNLDIVTTDRALPDTTRQQLANFGMADFAIDMHGEGSFDRGTGHLVLKQDDVILKGLGTLHMSFDVDGLQTDSTGQTPPAAALLAARVIHASFEWDDASLTRRLLHMAALRSGQSDDSLRATLALPLASASVFFPDQPDVAEQINAFLDGQHSLTVTIAPPAPVSLAEISAAGAAEKAHMLGVRIVGK
jgi:hypothetical protein